MYQNLILLAFCQALGMSITSSMLTSAGLVGQNLAPDPAWATLAISGQMLFMMLTSLPASILMQHKGRKYGFTLAAIVAMFAGAGAAWAIYSDSFLGFIFSLMGLGIATGFFQLFRFAAVDVVPASYAPKAISWVLLGGLIAAFVGPNLAAQTHLLDAEHPFFYTMLAIIPFGLVMLLVIRKIDIPMPSEEERLGEKRPIKVIVRQPVFIVAVLCGMIAYSTMTLLMTATPLAMKGHGFVFGQTAFIIQWHIVGMFAPSFFTGTLIRRFGVLKIMLTGVCAYFIVIAINMQPQSIVGYWFALVLLGIGWNFSFIGATTLLQGAWLPAEKGRVQGINDTLVFSMSAFAAMSSGFLYTHLGWKSLNLVALPFIATAGSLIIYMMLRRARREKMQAIQASI